MLLVKELKKYFPVERGLLRRKTGEVRAVDGVSFEVREGETLGLVGESGCGKTTLARVILRLIPPSGGKVIFEGVDIFALGREEMRRLRSKMQIIFQDPFSSLNPRHTIGAIIGEPLLVHRMAKGKEMWERVCELLKMVGLPEDSISRYPHQFSGGQRQRIGIARALATNPRFIIADEPVSSLDVSVGGEIINLLVDLQERLGLSYLFISHDLRMVEWVSDVVAVMYLGKIVEIAPKEDIYNRPHHPYTEALLSAVPQSDPRIRRKRIILEGDLPSPAHPPSGCPFHPRCPKTSSTCRRFPPHLRSIDGDHLSACHLS
jgi:oligopeptide/dipeptide ABC transporter ATP-binding protein